MLRSPPPCLLFGGSILVWSNSFGLVGFSRVVSIKWVCFVGISPYLFPIFCMVNRLDIPRQSVPSPAWTQVECLSSWFSPLRDLALGIGTSVPSSPLPKKVGCRGCSCTCPFPVSSQLSRLSLAESLRGLSQPAASIRGH